MIPRVKGTQDILPGPSARWEVLESIAHDHKLGAGLVAIVGDDEVARGVAMVRNMTSSEQKEVPLDRLVEHLKEEIGG